MVFLQIDFMCKTFEEVDFFFFSAVHPSRGIFFLFLHNCMFLKAETDWSVRVDLSIKLHMCSTRVRVQ